MKYNIRAVFGDASHDAIYTATAPLENSGDDVTARASGEHMVQTEWACNSDSCVELCQALHRNLPCRSQRRWRTTTWPKMSWAFWRRKFVIWKSVRWVFELCSRGSQTRVSDFVDHAMTVFLTRNKLILFAGKAWFLQETGGRRKNAQWRSKGAFIRGEVLIQLVRLNVSLTEN